MIMDVQKQDRHLLLLVKDPDGHAITFSQASDPRRISISKFLCGHDERNWFTCAVPGKASTVFQAKQDLKPKDLQDLTKKIKNGVPQFRLMEKQNILDVFQRM